MTMEIGRAAATVKEIQAQLDKWRAGLISRAELEESLPIGVNLRAVMVDIYMAKIKNYLPHIYGGGTAIGRIITAMAEEHVEMELRFMAIMEDLVQRFPALTKAPQVERLAFEGPVDEIRIIGNPIPPYQKHFVKNKDDGIFTKEKFEAALKHYRQINNYPEPVEATQESVVVPMAYYTQKRDLKDKLWPNGNQEEQDKFKDLVKALEAGNYDATPSELKEGSWHGPNPYNESPRAAFERFKSGDTTPPKAAGKVEKKPNGTTVITLPGKLGSKEGWKPMNFDTLDEKKCECGSEAANIPTHSSWCPRSTK